MSVSTSVNTVNAVSRVEPPTPTARSSDQPDRTSAAPSTSSGGHKAVEEAAPLRFPWLSWETRDLAIASKQPSPYGNIPLLGKELDQKV